MRTAPIDYIEVEKDFTTSRLFIYTYRFTKHSGRMHIVEYVDIDTGEIIPKEQAQVKEIRPDAMLERFRRLDTLRKEVRDFTTFLLHFRNQACGFLVPVEMIIEWYAALYNKRSSNVRRYIPSLIESGILQDHFSLDKIFMVNNPNRKAHNAKGDLTKAQVIYDTIRLKTKSI